MRISYVIPYLMFISGSFALICGINALYMDKRSPQNIVYMLLTMSLRVWTVGLTLSTVAPTLNLSLFWRYISALGWGPFYSILLHFIILLTGRDRLLKKWWSYLLLYFPAIVVICTFALPIGINTTPYIMERTIFGWINLNGTGLWDWFFYIYFSLTSIIGFVLIATWSKESKTTEDKKLSRALLYAFISAFAIGSVTDVLLGFLAITIPKVAPIFISIPIGVIAYIINKYGFMVSKEPNEHERILNKATQSSIYRHLSAMLAIGIFVHIVAQTLLYKTGNITSILWFSGLIFLIIAFIELVNYSSRSDSTKETLVGVILSAALPVYTMAFLDSGSTTVWAAVFIAILIALVFNKLTMLTAIVSSSFFSQMLLWTISPTIVTTIYQPDYIVRIALLLLALVTAIYVNKLYVSKLKENTYQIGLHKLVSDISYDMATINISNSSEKMTNLLMQIGKFIFADSGYLLIFNSTGGIGQTYSWHKSSPNTLDSTIDQLPPFIFPELMERINSNIIVELQDSHKIPHDIPRIRQTLIDNDIRSLIALPVLKEGSVAGLLSFSSSAPFNNWYLDTANSLGVIRNVVSNALIKVDKDREIDFLAYYDQLTKLPNRVLFNDRVNQTINLAHRSGNMLALVFLDLDSFKSVNDSMGHELGDRLLVEVASMLQKNIRKADAVSRFGGDEFIMMLGNITSTADVHGILSKLVSLFNKPIKLDNQEFYVTASLGAALYPHDGENVETLIKNADIAMYRAKDHGKNQYKLCSDDMKDEVIEEIKLTNLLYRAEERGEFSLLYQPQMHLDDNKIVALEALIRWNLPGGDTIPPRKFIHLAERSGSIHSIGEWVIRSACRQIKHWQDMVYPKLRVSVNVSINQLRNLDFPTQISTILAEECLSPQYLELEITEHVASHHTEAIIKTLQEIKKLGISLSIDDFGTEYTSLAKLKTLPIDRIKMDMQFVHAIEGTEDDKAAAKVLICVSKTLGCLW